MRTVSFSAVFYLSNLSVCARPLPPRPRYVCLDCPLESEDGDGEHSSIDLCEPCFLSASVAHVGPTGEGAEEEGGDEGGGVRPVG